jgi:threonine/homoserine/homoserine lactone efflux protein
MSELVAFILLSAAVICTPGPDTAVTVRSALVGGRSAGVSTALGCITGHVCWVLAASAGVAALLVASEPAFMTLKVAGAAYLIYLGAKALATAFRGDGDPLAGAGEPRGRLSRTTAFRQGLVSDLGNPKIAAFFTSLLPQFGGASFWAMLGYGLLFAALTFVWLALYSAAIDAMRALTSRPRFRRGFEAVTGTVLVGLGVRLATEKPPG